MKIIIYQQIRNELTQAVINSIRKLNPQWINDVILADVYSGEGADPWAEEQDDFTYVYFDEPTLLGDAFNQIISGLELDDDILFMRNCFAPVGGCFDAMLETLGRYEDAFAIGTMSNLFINVNQRASWESYKAACEWCADETGDIPMMRLDGSAILIKRDELVGETPFSNEYKDEDNIMFDFCFRRFLEHKRMYVSKKAGFYGLIDCRWLVHSNEKLLLEKNLGIHYFSAIGNSSIVSMIDSDADKEIRVLEIGCDCGGTLFMIKRLFPNAKLYGAELNPNSARVAAEFATVKVDNIEDKVLDFGENDFDYIIFGDVLEHLRDPLSTLVYCKGLLKEGGAILASIPNLMHYTVMRNLLNGNFTYTEEGLLDKTHIHMFTYNEIVRMFRDKAGYDIESINFIDAPMSDSDAEFVDKLIELGEGATTPSYYKAYQFFVRARKV